MFFGVIRVGGVGKGGGGGGGREEGEQGRWNGGWGARLGG